MPLVCDGRAPVRVTEGWILPSVFRYPHCTCTQTYTHIHLYSEERVKSSPVCVLEESEENNAPTTVDLFKATCFYGNVISIHCNCYFLLFALLQLGKKGQIVFNVIVIKVQRQTHLCPRRSSCWPPPHLLHHPLEKKVFFLAFTETKCPNVVLLFGLPWKHLCMCCICCRGKGLN